MVSPKCFASDPQQLKSAREDIKELLRSKFCHPILVLIFIIIISFDTVVQFLQQLAVNYQFSIYLYVILSKKISELILLTIIG